MFQVILVSTGRVVATSLNSDRDARTEAIRHVKADLATTPQGRRLLGWCKNNVTWKVAAPYVLIAEMVGVWIDTAGGRVLPEDVEDDERILFKNRKGEVLFGTFDAGEDTFTTTDGRTFISDNVTAFFIIPE